jgi:hypothetical protein
MAQAVRRRPLHVRSRVSPCGIYGGQSGTGTGFFPRVLRFSPVNFITMGTGLSPGVKRPGRDVDNPPHLAPRLKKV